MLVNINFFVHHKFVLHIINIVGMTLFLSGEWIRERKKKEEEGSEDVINGGLLVV